MNIHTLQKNESLRDKLAAEYVLGTLKGRARRRFEAWMRMDKLIEAAVREWEARLHPMAEFVPEVQPSPRVWSAIEQQLALSTLHAPSSSRQPGKQARPVKSSWWSRLRDDLGFWRGLGLTTTAMATVLVAVLVTRQPDSPLPAADYVAALANEAEQPVAVVTGYAARNQLVVQIVLPQQISADKSFELWAVPKEGAPRSLGLIPAKGVATLQLPEGVTPDSVPLLAISLEPKGGSPDRNAPSGPILFKGTWTQI